MIFSLNEPQIKGRAFLSTPAPSYQPQHATSLHSLQNTASHTAHALYLVDLTLLLQGNSLHTYRVGPWRLDIKSPASSVSLSLKMASTISEKTLPQHPQ
jgi:hypothetical protein